MPRFLSWWAAGTFLVGLAAACGSTKSSEFGDPGGSAGGGGDGGGPSLVGSASGVGGASGQGGATAGDLVLTPATTTLDVPAGAAPPTVQLSLSDGATHAAIAGAAFRTDRTDAGTIGASTGLFTAAGVAGGTVVVSADFGGHTATATVLVKRHVVANGASDALGSVPPGATSLTAFGAGGYGGVGGDGSGGAVSASQQAALDAAGAGGDGAGWLYPYDQTVFPRGILAPLLQWSVGSSGDYDAIKVHLVEASYEYTGYFARPVLAKTFGDHPLPVDAWTGVFDSYRSATGAEDVSVTVTLLPHAGAAFALPTRTWHIAGGGIRGKIYYQSYGTRFATSVWNDYDGKVFGGATLAISPGASAPDAVAIAGSVGTAPYNDTTCRVCHSVASSGAALVTQEGQDKGISDLYDLVGSTSGTIGNGAQSAYPAISPDGTMMLTNTVPGTGDDAQPSTSTFVQIPAGATVAFAGLPGDLSAVYPAFSPDGAHVAYTEGSGGIGNGGPLTLAPVDLVGKTFGTPMPLYAPPAGQNAYWPSFMPASDAVVFENEVVWNGRDYGGTRAGCDTKDGACLQSGAHGELWYVSARTGSAHRLDAANGDGYLPPHPSALPADVGKDAEMSYEPTVNPVVSGGYAWIVFTSRRRYGNVATINPFTSDPRYTDLSSTPTTKKLWVAAVKIDGDGSVDVSSPAFYLPGQELMAGNGRGFWVVDPCQADGASCSAGDQCCGGYCGAGDTGGALTCSATKPSCAAQYDRCTSSADCCDGSSACVGGRCAATPVR